MSVCSASSPRLAILVVDDMAASREQLCALIETLGHEAVGAASGAIALARVAQQPPDIVLLDLLMPDLDGFEVTRRIRQIKVPRWLPVIVTSALQGDDHFIHALEHGADDCLARPVNAALLAAKLRHYARVLDLQSRHEALAQRQGRILDNIHDAVITLDGRGTIVEANLAAARRFGSGTPASLMGQTGAALLGIGLPTLLAGGEQRVDAADGCSFPAEIRASEWTEDAQPHWTLVVRDLTEQRRIERMKDEFLATVSHELRTPLTSVLGAVGLLAAGAAGPLPPAARPLTEAAQRNGARLSQLIDDILDLTKLEGDRLVMHIRRAAVGTLLAEAHAANQGYAQRAGITLINTVAPGGGAIELRVDPDRFLQVMANLLSNAIKHSPAGETVSIELATTPDHVRVSVRDRGRGIDPAFRDRMFAKFSQADGSDRRAQGGTGLGLYISRMLVERMGGSIGVEPAQGDGTVFTVSFPRADAVPVPARPPVVIVDSDVDARERVAAWLEPLANVEAVASLGQCGEPAPDRGPPVVVADTRAQGDAEAFCAALRRIAAGRPVILYSDSVDHDFAQRMGATWLRKATTRQDELVRTVRAGFPAARVRPSGSTDE